jgi:hypothetical protein
LAASIADAAIATGVTGTAGLRAGVSADPVTAQEIITLRCITRLEREPQCIASVWEDSAVKQQLEDGRSHIV